MSDVSLFTLEYWHWFALAAVLASVEMLAPGVFFLWLGAAALITGLLTFFLADLGNAGQLTSFAVFSVVLVYLAFKYFRGKKQETDQPALNDRAAHLIGKTGPLEEAIIGGSGRARFGDTTWKVEGPDMPAGTLVKVIGSQGTVMKVEKLADAPAPQASAHHSAHAADPRVDKLSDSLQEPLDRKED